MSITDYALEQEPGHAESWMKPRVLCKRCKQYFVCDVAEHQGAIDCPACEKIAWLSDSDLDLLRLATAERVLDGAPKDGYRSVRRSQMQVVRLYRSNHAELLKVGARIRENPGTTCPNCTYDLSGMMNDEEIVVCPECGQETSRKMSALLWGERGLSARRLQWATYGYGMTVGLLSWLALLCFAAQFNPNWYGLFSEILILVGAIFLATAAVFGFGLPFLVTSYASRLARLRSPGMSPARSIGIGACWALANAAVAGLMIYLGALVIG